MRIECHVDLVFSILNFSLKFISEQDETLLKMESSVLNTKHIALAINSELDLHNRLLVSRIKILLSISPYFLLNGSFCFIGRYTIRHGHYRLKDEGQIYSITLFWNLISVFVT